MRGNGGRMQEWIKYAALFVLAVAAFGVAAIALMGPQGAGEAGPVPSSTLEATPTPSASVAPTSPAPAPTAAATTPQPGIALPAEPVLLVMGDSYTAGVGADQPDQGWAYLVAGQLGYPTNIDGVSGTGFAWGGGGQDELAGEYEVRLQEIAADPAFVPNVLILQGGQNDSRIPNLEEVTAATAQTIEAARRFWPGVQVVVLGPSAPQPLAEELRGVNSAVRAGAAAAGAPFIDATEAGWFTTANSPGFDADGAHPNSAGHAYIAEKFLQSWAALIQ
ncbi:SGNH/GDSL hydrolase family protein [Pseudarthrobacter sp. R1]|uniref:SGNH/GDSL hydrolase family protein n=1 Tax=Pseudarthrobacter sp. R1 TaxID=2944934 RepID=UPI002109BD15|nr:SGNH/GDSL hydrolase family protein [Pseudarthrobacter sp. R1]MCQ6271149.1 SGNH/GDSL hydrolase family protein [Pseudarthrobacter sp. R1]